MTKQNPELSAADHVSELQAAGYRVLGDGGDAVIVIGDVSRIPLDRPVGALDLLSTTRARRFSSVKEAARWLKESNQ